MSAAELIRCTFALERACVVRPEAATTRYAALADYELRFARRFLKDRWRHTAR